MIIIHPFLLLFNLLAEIGQQASLQNTRDLSIGGGAIERRESGFLGCFFREIFVPERHVALSFQGFDIISHFGSWGLFDLTHLTIASTWAEVCGIGGGRCGGGES